MNMSPNFPQGVSADLSISDLADRTGLTPATLRTWESRHGFPVPHRLAGGHRRYSEAHVAQVEQVLRHRTGGMTLEAAVERVRDAAVAGDRSVFATLRRSHPQLPVQTLRKSTLLALSRSLEDECCARAERPVLFGSFQHRRFFERARHRWDELARTARTAVAVADFGAAEDASAAVVAGTPTLVHVPASAPMRREWTVVCDAPDYPACMTAWELPGQSGTPDSERLFEALWTLDPAIVRAATVQGAHLVRQFAPHLVDDLDLPRETPRQASADLAHATSLFHRVLSHVDGLRT